MADESYTFQVGATVLYEVTVDADDEDDAYIVIMDEFGQVQNLVDDDRAVAVSESIDIGGVKGNA